MLKLCGCSLHIQHREQNSSAVAPWSIWEGEVARENLQKQLNSRVFESETWNRHGCCPDGFKGVHLDIQREKKHLLNN